MPGSPFEEPVPQPPRSFSSFVQVVPLGAVFFTGTVLLARGGRPDGIYVPPPPRFSPVVMSSRPHHAHPGSVVTFRGQVEDPPVPQPERLTTAAVRTTLSPGPRPHSGFVQILRPGRDATMGCKPVYSSPTWTPASRPLGSVFLYRIPPNRFDRPVPGIQSLARYPFMNREGVVQQDFSKKGPSVFPRLAPTLQSAPSDDGRWRQPYASGISFNVTKVDPINSGTRKTVLSLERGYRFHSGSVVSFGAFNRLPAPTKTTVSSLQSSGSLPWPAIPSGSTALGAPYRVELVQRPRLLQVSAFHPVPYQGLSLGMNRGSILSPDVPARVIWTVTDGNRAARYNRDGFVWRSGWRANTDVAPTVAYDFTYCIGLPTREWTLAVPVSGWTASFPRSEWEPGEPT